MKGVFLRFMFSSISHKNHNISITQTSFRPSLPLKLRFSTIFINFQCILTLKFVKNYRAKIFSGLHAKKNRLTMNENAKTQSSATISHTERNTYDF